MRTKFYIFLISLLFYAYFTPVGPDANSATRLDLIYSIVNYKTTTIDKYHSNTVDKSHFKKHYYSDKAPGAALLGLPVLTFYEKLVPSLAPDNTFSNSIITFFVIVLPAALGIIIFFSITEFFFAERKQNIILTLFYAFGTLACNYSSFFYGHQIASCISLTSFYLVLRERTQIRRMADSEWRMANEKDAKTLNFSSATIFLCAFFSSFAVITEYALITNYVILFLYIFISKSDDSFAPGIARHNVPSPEGHVQRAPTVGIADFSLRFFNCSIKAIALKNARKCKLTLARYKCFPRFQTAYQVFGFFILGSILPIIFFLLYNKICYDSFFKIGYLYETDKVFKTEMAKGFLGITGPNIKSFWEIMFKPTRGIFWLSPFLLFAIPGFYFFMKDKIFRFEGFCSFIIVSGYVLFNSSYYMPGGGWSIGPRHLIPALPYMVLSAGFALKELQQYTRGYLRWNLVFIILGLLSIFSTVTAHITAARLPTIFAKPVFQFALPVLYGGYITDNIGHFFGLKGFISILPLIIIIVGILLLWILSDRQLLVTTSLNCKLTNVITLRRLKFLSRRLGVPAKAGRATPKSDAPGVASFNLRHLSCQPSSLHLFISSSLTILICVIMIVFYFYVGFRTEKTELANRLHFIAVFFNRSNLLDSSLNFYKKVVLLEPTNPKVYLGIASIYNKQGRFREAEKFYKKTIELNSTIIEPYLSLGEIYYKTSRYADTVHILQSAIKVNNKNIIAHEALAAAYFMNKQYPETQNEISQILKLNPYSKTANMLLKDLSGK